MSDRGKTEVRQRSERGLRKDSGRGRASFRKARFRLARFESLPAKGKKTLNILPRGRTSSGIPQGPCVPPELASRRSWLWPRSRGRGRGIDVRDTSGPRALDRQRGRSAPAPLPARRLLQTASETPAEFADEPERQDHLEGALRFSRSTR
jgi:hypothetical protein